jgi:hypothetical protein
MEISMKMAALIAAALALVALTGCGDDDNPASSGGDGGAEITFPLAIGNVWVSTITSDTTAARSASTDTTRVFGMEDYAGQTYYALESVTDGVRDTALVRQSGQEVYVVQSFDAGKSKGDENPLVEWLTREFEKSMPWKMADFDAGAGTEWTLADAETTFTVDEEETTVRITALASSGGRTSITVPAGEFDDVYLAELEVTLAIGVPPVTLTSEITSQKLWVADGAGIVKDENVGYEDDNGTKITTTTVLTDYQLGR